MLEPPTTPCCEVVRCKGLCWNDFSHLSASRLAWMVAGFFFRSPDGRMILKYVWGLVLCWCSMFPPRNGSNISPPQVIGEDSDMALIEADDEEQTAAQQLSWVEKVFRNSGGSG